MHFCYDPLEYSSYLCRGGSLGICFVCCMLYGIVWKHYNLQQSSKETAASSYLAIIFGRIASGVPLLLCSTAEQMQHPHQCRHLCRLHNWHEVFQVGWIKLPLLLLLWGLSDSRIAKLCEMLWSFSIELHSEVSGSLGMSGNNSPRHAQNPLSGERRKTLSITLHALSPPPSHHHLYIIHSINSLQRFYLISMSLKWPFVSKNDVKQ